MHQKLKTIKQKYGKVNYSDHNVWQELPLQQHISYKMCVLMSPIVVPHLDSVCASLLAVVQLSTLPGRAPRGWLQNVFICQTASLQPTSHVTQKHRLHSSFWETFKTILFMEAYYWLLFNFQSVPILYFIV